MNQKSKIYAVRHKSSEVLEQSRSGGVFTALSDYILSHNGKVYGCILDERFEAKHIGTGSRTQRDLMRESKYIQSNLGDSFKQIKKDLENGIMVLFSGTSCQVAGLRCFLGKEYSNLFCLDIVCHGVPSVLVWRKYLKWICKKFNINIEKVQFRNKNNYGWREHIESVYSTDGERIDSNIYAALFYGHHTLRPACYRCKYKTLSHPGDITIGDYWGIEKAASEFDDDKGVSLVFVNSEKGYQLLNFIDHDVEKKETSVEDSMQPPLFMPFYEPLGRKWFWINFYCRPFEKILKRYVGRNYYLEKKGKSCQVKRV
ncbi:MAG: Coenzyme F420 hydrogenase/dehydrogenase, beta subunit C-terminal domain [Lachnospiraceae bacterium]